MGKLGLQKGSLQGILHISKDNFILLLIHTIYDVYEISYMSIRVVSKHIHVWYEKQAYVMT